MAVPFQIDLAGKVAAVTGGGGVLCGCMAKALAECGAKVAILDLRKDAADKVAGEIKAAGFEATGFACSVLERESLEAALVEIKAQYGPIDILINGAGGNHPLGTTSREYLLPEDLDSTVEGFKTFYDLDPDGIQFVFNLNFIGTLLPTQVFTKDMAAGGSGVVVNISSMNAFTPLTKIPAYSGAKAAVSNFTQWLAVHMSKVGIRVNAIAPGFFLTDQNRALLTNEDGSMTDRGQTIINHTPMGKYGTPEDLLGALLWLCGDPGAGFVTGTVVAVDGGFAAFSGV
ncbi:MAG: SDR family oxidoreductase [Victivallales bacterium]|jgi:NAD(P)-dependent dehydrogenase (short-subunit alcohol dehydrogenase family)|nr:SDR family oxidoreductase [Victivallales bacterium]MBT7164857.1 SDR family oxidoreductase [Victivallales bacterium]MBT7303263.1 SDR family oxidoreductase [Victivallales bacterium]